MGTIEKRRFHILTTRVEVFLLLPFMAALVWTGFAGSVLLYDFEGGVEGWENESSRPVPAQVSTAQARHGQQSLAFTHSFSKSFGCLQCRVKAGFPRDYSAVSLRGFSAWIYIPRGRPNWDAKMFVRSGTDWTWAEGPEKKGLEPGWHKLEIPYDKITDLSTIQDMGVQVMNFREPLEATICIDQVEMITQESNTVAGVD